MSFKRGTLRYFVTVAEEGQMTRAAAKLHMAQPALSQAIASLEAELGLELFERHGRGVALTAAGEALLPIAREAVARERDATETAHALLRAARGSLVVGFVGPPPALSETSLFERFCEEHPDVDVSYRDLPYPCGRTSAWLREVDVALCQPPEPEEGISHATLRYEPRAVLTNNRHPLAARSELPASEILAETFVAYHPEVQPTWAAFHNLDDLRGGPPVRTSGPGVLTTLEMVTGMLTRAALTVVPLTDAVVASQALSELVAIPLRDVAPGERAVVWRADTPNDLVRDLVGMVAKP